MTEEIKDKFCRLCGKNKPEAEVNPIPLARLMDNSLIGVDACKLCSTVVHNIRQICMEAEQMLKQKLDAEVEAKKLASGNKIIIPSVMVPRNLKGPLKVN